MKKKQSLLIENDFSVDLTFNNISVSLLSEFATKIVQPYYNGNLNAAVQDLLTKALTEQDFVLSHITHIRNKKTRRKVSERKDFSY
ncbi:MAG TPA: hypothetical protein VK209_11170 [Candidatus Sulfotelmatobacter sp.]|nr:hypothetical protein [Candidatus Sulfotelmatobacter sp.]